MTTEDKKRFTVISNTNFDKEKEREQIMSSNNYQTNPLREKLVKFKAKEKFSVGDFLKW